MRGKISLTYIGLSMLLIFTMQSTVYAADASAMEFITVYKEYQIQESEEDSSLTKAPLFTTRYVVCVNKATMRSGPGNNYSSLGTLYKNDVVWVRSISNGWAKFKINSKWHYISAACIKKQ